MNYNLKRVIGCLIYVAAFGLLVVLAEDLNRHFEDVFRSTFRLPYFWLFITQFVLPILMGCLLALPQFIRTSRQEGSWKADWIVLLAVGLPAFCIAVIPVGFYTLAYFIQPENGAIPLSSLFFWMSHYPALPKVFGILLGFVLLTSPGKQSRDEEAAPEDIEA
jgi:hypothetical protein